MVVDVYAFVANCTQCARSRVGKRRKTKYLKTFPPTEPLTDLCMDLRGPLSRTAAGNEHLLVIVVRFSKMTRAIPLQRIDAETIAAAFLDTWVAAYGPPATVLSDNGPQFRSTFFQGVCSLLGISNRYSTTYHPQTNGQVERYNRTFVGQLRKYVEDHQDRWDELVSMLTLAYNSRPQQSTGVAPLEFVTPERVRSLSVERLVGSPAPEETDGSPRAVREGIRARLRNLIHKVRKSLTLAQRRYKRNYDARVRPVNKDVHAGDWVFVDGHARTKYDLGTRAAGPYKVLSRGEGTFSLDIGGYPETVSSDHVTAAPGPPGDPQTLLQTSGYPKTLWSPRGINTRARSSSARPSWATKSLTMVRYACGPTGGGTTPRRTPSSWPVGSTYVRCTSTCGVWTYESKKPGRSSTSSPKTVPTRDTWFSSSESWPVFV